MQRRQMFSKPLHLEGNVEPARHHIQSAEQVFLFIVNTCLLSGVVLATDVQNTHLYILNSPYFFSVKWKQAKSTDTVPLFINIKGYRCS